MSDFSNVITDLHARKEQKKIGEILCDLGALKPAQIEIILEKMIDNKNLLFGSAGVELNMFTNLNIMQALSEQFGYDYATNDKNVTERCMELAFNPFGIYADKIRSVRNFLMRNWFSAENKSLVIMGVDVGDGVSTFAANLAISFAQARRETLLVDSDLRAGRQRQAFGIDDRLGLSDMLASRAGYAAIQRFEKFKSLSLLPSGTKPPNALELVSQLGYATLCGELSSHYETVLIDAPALCSGPDALETAAVVGAVLLVVRKNRTTTKGLLSLKNRLAEQNSRIIGYVVTDF